MVSPYLNRPLRSFEEAQAAEIRRGDRVEHPTWGRARVTGFDGNRVLIKTESGSQPHFVFRGLLTKIAPSGGENR